MDPGYPPHGDRRSERPQREAPYGEGQEQYYDQEQSEQQYEQTYSDLVPEIDPELSKPTILPPGTAVYRQPSSAGQTGYLSWGSPSSSRQQQQPQPQYFSGQTSPINQPGYYDNYTFGGQNAAKAFSLEPFTGDAQTPGVSQRQRPEKKYLCKVEDCSRSVPGNGFTTLNDLERHGRSKHNDDGQYIECRHPQCPDRGKRFPRRDNFIDHYWRVHGQGATKEQVKAYVLENLAKDWMVEKQGDTWREGGQ
ncbi:hypothetical protein TWF694_011202 [Orbilia ellipsospora]|uniref:C2H2-type domain-containing protein n=1 Tax=Orbilia ellipsospora TaxID=2528407 RepID=A0AAV9XEP6_9PEZI